MNKLVLIDGNSLINRAFYATPLTFTDSEGQPTNAVYGFTTMLLKAISDIAPTHLIVAFDVHAPTFRHKMYDGYKATRKGMPEELASQMPRLKKLLAAMKIKTCELSGYEADDLLGTIAKHTDAETLILTADNDYLQLIDKTTKILLTKKGLSELEPLDEKALYEKMGLKPFQIIELKSLMGDSSDNIPGVSGIGEKTALTLLEKYETMEGVYAHIDEITGKLHEKLALSRDMAELSHELATINVDSPVSVSLSECVLKFPFGKAVAEEFNALEFKSLLKRAELFSEDEVALPKTPDTENITLSKAEELERVLSENGDKKQIFIDLTGAISFCFDKTRCYLVALSQTLFDEGMDYDAAIGILKPILESESVKKVVFDKKKLKHDLDRSNITLRGVSDDLMLMQYVAEADNSISDAMSLAAFHGFEGLTASAALAFVFEELKDKIEKQNAARLYEMEMRLADVLYEMEKSGFTCDKSVLELLSKQYTAELNDLAAKIKSLAGRDLNINSPKQLAELLYDDLKVLYQQKGKATRSTDAETLEKAFDRHEIIPLILRYRQISKLNSTYVEGLLAQIDDSGKIHTVFNQALTTTGRLSSKEPNLQNIPVRTEEGKVLRKVFVSESAESVLVSADYSQIELRLLAAFSGEQALIDAFNRGDDVHAMTAATVNNVALSAVTSEMRRHAKAVNFGIIYGISDFGLARQIGTTNNKARDIIKTYFEKYPRVRAYMDENVEKCRQRGYAETVIGRRRVIKDINSSNFNLRSFSERAAMNMPLQGSAADIIKEAMINVFDSLKREGLKSKLILQIHDELICDVKLDELERVKEIMKREMEGAATLSVPLDVNISYGRSWYDAK